VRLLLLARHGRSLFNVDGVVNGDPTLDRGLSEQGQEEARKLGAQIAAHAIDLCVVSAFPRAQETARIALGERAQTVHTEVDPQLNDIRIGELEGKTLADYRAWKHVHTRRDRFPGGESLDEAADRYAAAFARLLEHDAATVLCVCHEIPVRYAVNAFVGSADLDHPHHDIANATPYVFDAAGLRRAVEELRR
jgi:2,3-bisphosphoglycerate-dependent phosphoglycerate mutase